MCTGFVHIMGSLYGINCVMKCLIKLSRKDQQLPPNKLMNLIALENYFGRSSIGFFFC